jgi:hypothetical protein
MAEKKGLSTASADRNGNNENNNNDNNDDSHNDVELKDSIHGEGLTEFQKDLGITDDEDPALLIIAWKLNSRTVWEISLNEWMNGFTHAGYC